MTDQQSLRAALKPEFVTVSLNLASKSITDWGKWNELEGFPVNGTWQDKILFIDSKLQDALKSIQHRPNERMYWRTRPDLNKYRGWLLNKVLHHQLAVQNGNAPEGIILPEDLPKCADSLYVYHKHHKEIGAQNPEARTLQHYTSLSALSDAVKPYEASYPLIDFMRQMAHERFLTEHGGNGEAKLIGTLKDGTEIIQVLSEEASRAYGSPRWCTAYPNQDTYFKDYKDDLLIAIEPDGRRWQFHFRTMQFNDENDRHIKDLTEFLADRPDLAEALLPFWDKTLGKALNKCWKLGTMSPVWGNHLAKEGGKLEQALDGLFCKRSLQDEDDYKRDQDSTTAVFFNFLKEFHKAPEFQPILEGYIFDHGFEAFTNESAEPSRHDRHRHRGFWNIVLSNAEWRDRVLIEGQLSTSLRGLVFSENEMHLSMFLDLVKKCSHDPELQDIAESWLTGEGFDVFQVLANEEEKAYRAPYKYKYFYGLIMSAPKWRDIAMAKDINDTAFDFLDRSFLSYDYETGKSSMYEYTGYLGMCRFVSGIPEWEEYAREKGYIQNAIDHGYIDSAFDKYEGHADDVRLFGYTAHAYVNLWQAVLSFPSFRAHAKDQKRLPKMLELLFADKQPEAQSEDRRRFRSGDRSDPSKTFMFLMQTFYNQPEFRDELTPYIGRAIEMSKGKSAYFKRKHRDGRTRPPVDITAEILKYAALVPEWRKAVEAHDIDNALRHTDTIPLVLEASKRKGLEHWRKAIIASKAVTEFVKAGDISFRHKSAEEIVRGYEPYETAFGQYL